MNWKLIHKTPTNFWQKVDYLGTDKVSGISWKAHRSHFVYGDDILKMEVKDIGVGMEEEALNHMIESGFSTKGEDRGVIYPLPGRNEKCLCGSGKKFKKCCETLLR